MVLDNQQGYSLGKTTPSHRIPYLPAVLCLGMGSGRVPPSIVAGLTVSLFKSCLFKLYGYSSSAISRIYFLIANILFLCLMKSFCLLLHNVFWAWVQELCSGWISCSLVLQNCLFCAFWSVFSLMVSFLSVAKQSFYSRVRAIHSCVYNDLCSLNTGPWWYENFFSKDKLLYYTK